MNKSTVPSAIALDERPRVTFERQLGDTELSFYLISRGNGAGDIFIRLGCRANPSLIEQGRVRLVWSILRLRHPLLAAKTCLRDYGDVKFVYELPNDLEAALSSADENLQFSSQRTDDLTDSITNGTRTLSDSRLSYVIVNVLGCPGSGGSGTIDCDFFFCAGHFIADGMALHMLANDFFDLLGSDKTMGDLTNRLEDELTDRKASMKYLPNNVENNLPQTSNNTFQKVARRIDYLTSNRSNIGGHVFPRRDELPKRNVIKYQVFDTETTRAILGKCKSECVSISGALSVVCNYAWARTTNNLHELPILMHPAHNLRPYLTNEATLHDSYVFLSIGFLSVVLPTYIPPAQNSASIFWHRSREVKKQLDGGRKTPMLASRCRELAREMSQSVQTRARQNDLESVSQELALFEEQPLSQQLLGLSLLGNLDAVYKHAKFPGLQLQTLFAGSRQSSDLVLLVSYTFAGRLWVKLRYDEIGFDKIVMERFWENMLQVMDEYLL